MAAGLSTETRNARLNVFTTQAGSAAKLTLYSSTRPATGGTPTTALCVFTCGSPFAPSAANGVLTLNTLTADSVALASGTATWARLTRSDGTTHVADFGVSPTGGGGDLQMDNPVIQIGAVITPGTVTITDPNA